MHEGYVLEPQVKVRVKVVPKGEEGAYIKLTKISPKSGNKPEINQK